jgi:Uma2 family endonuclease
VTQDIWTLLDAYVAPRKLGRVGLKAYLVALSRNDVEPDVCFWRSEISAKFTRDQILFPPPDLVVEVLSESTAAYDRGTKFEDYASHGIGEYWIVDADTATLEQYVLRGDQYELRLKGSDGTVRLVAIEGADFPVRALFDDAENDRAVAAARPAHG